ncbi:MAG: hypothetical protein WD271_15935 [Acidimicrobiia bacterium]
MTIEIRAASNKSGGRGTSPLQEGSKMTSPLSGMAGSERAILLVAVRGLVAEARSERSLLSASSPERQFYLGVEAAAEEVLHLELGSSRGMDWLDRQPSAFRDGYLRTSTLLANATTAADPPFRLPLPDSRLAR